MNITDPNLKSYKPLNKFLHWFVALLVFVLLIVGFLMQSMDKNLQPLVYTIHKSTGITVLFLMIWRIFAIVHNRRPPLPAHMHKAEVLLAKFVQNSMYLFLILMPLSGWIMSTASGKAPAYYFLFKFPLPGVERSAELAQIMRQAHGVIAWILIGLITLHIMGALKHFLIDKDEVLQSML